MTLPAAEAARHARFEQIRYAQVWEDADILLTALEPGPGDTCLSIASAGDNVLSLLSRGPDRVIAIDLNPTQIACLALRVAAFRELSHEGVLGLIGIGPCDHRKVLYQQCRRALDDNTRRFWDAHPDWIARGIGHVGKFERYFEMFRTRIMPWIHSQTRIRSLFTPRNRGDRTAFYEKEWNNWRWKLLFHLFFSRTVMGRLGRDPSFFRYVEGPVSTRILQRARHALTELDPCQNPYLQWILLGTYETALPHYLRPENFDPIRNHLHRLTWSQLPLETFLHQQASGTLSKFNLSDIFEYMSEENTSSLLAEIASRARPGGRLAYWNMLAPRQAGPHLADRLRPVADLGEKLHQIDKAFFYSAFRVEEVVG